VREKYCSGWKNKLKKTDYKPGEQALWEPSSIRQINPFCKAWRPRTILRQEYEIPGPSLACRIEPLVPYFALNSCAHKESGFYKILHPLRANIARLKRWRSLYPSPPSSFLLHISSQGDRRKKQ
jgi:hypothetical protein